MSARRLGALVKGDTSGELQRELDALVEKRVARIRSDSRRDLERLRTECDDEITRLKVVHAREVARLRAEMTAAAASTMTARLSRLFRWRDTTSLSGSNNARVAMRNEDGPRP